MFHQKHRLYPGFLALLFLTIIISLYYVWHKPIGTQEAIRIARSFGQFMAALSIVAVGGGLGKRLVWKDQPGLAQMAVQAGLGCGILGVVFLVNGALIGVNSVLAWLVLIALVVVFWRDMRGWWSSLGEFRNMWLEGTHLGRWIAPGLGLILMTTLLTVLAPPLKFDALVYHLALPRYYHLAGRIVYTPWLIYWGMPQTAEMLYTLATSIAGVEAGAILGWMLGVLAIIGLAGYLYNRMGVGAAWAGVAALTAGYTFSSSLAWAYVDWVVVLFGFCTIASMEKWESSGDKHSLILSGAFAGLALGTKYTAGVIMLAGMALIIWNGIRQRVSFRVVIQNLIYFILPAVVITLPWWVKNMLATGNAFYPFFSSAGAMDQFRLDFYNIPIWGDWRDVVLLPILATLTGVEGAPGYSASIGPLLLGLSVCAFLGWKNWTEKERHSVHIATVIGLVGLIVWAVAGRLSGYLIQSRLFAAVFPAFAVLAGAGFKALSQVQGRGIRLGRVTSTLIVLVYAFTVIETGRNALNQNVPQELLGTIDSEDYLKNNLSWYAVAMQTIQKLPEDSMVLMLWEPRSLYCLPKCVPDEVIDRWKHDLFIWKDPRAILQSWRASGYTHLLYYRFGADFVRREDLRYSTADWKNLDALLAGLPLISDIGEAYILYSLNP